MLSMLAIAASLSPPIASADGSLNPCPPVVPAGAGEGVAGAFVFEVPVGAAGAAGAAGVDDVWAGVAGAALLDVAAGAGFGYKLVNDPHFLDSGEIVDAHAPPPGSDKVGRQSPLTFDTIHTMKPFSSMLYDSTVFPSCKILPIHISHR